MRLAFMGSPDFAVPALRALHAAGHDIVAVYCQPPRPAGRGQAVRKCPVHLDADRLNLMVRTPVRLRSDAAAQADFAALDLDAAVVAAYGLILPQAMLDAPHLGCLNIHASLLPRWRGAAPIHAAILAGDTQTGVTVMQMDAGLDTGAMLLKRSIAIEATATTAQLHDRLADMGAEMILQALATKPPPQAQPEDGATYAPKLSREDGRIDWSRRAADLDRQIRAFDPWPGTFTTLHGAVFKILGAALAQGSGPPGTTCDDQMTVACGEGALRLTKVQLPGRSALAADAFLRGHKMPTGTVLGS